MINSISVSHGIINFNTKKIFELIIKSLDSQQGSYSALNNACARFGTIVPRGS